MPFTREELKFLKPACNALCRTFDWTLVDMIVGVNIACKNRYTVNNINYDVALANLNY